jgi:uncharacterized protein
MINRAFQHLPGIGPRRLQRLEQAGIRDWTDLENRLPELGLGPAGRDRLRHALAQCREACAAADIARLIRTLHPADHWRILGAFFEGASYFDIETSGLDADSTITVIACHHRGSLHTFVRGRNLDAFLDLLDEVRLLVSFNGASFDVPRVLAEFHVPAIPCPHLDLRWICHHQHMRGGLKHIEQTLGLQRPTDLQGVDGQEAVWLWKLWEARRNPQALDRLVRYCAADAVCLHQVAARLLAARDCPVTTPDPDQVWACLHPTLIHNSPMRVPPPPPTPSPDPSPTLLRLERHWQRLQHR